MIFVYEKCNIVRNLMAANPIQLGLVVFALRLGASTCLRFVLHIQCQLDKSSNPLERDSNSLLLGSDDQGD